ncbi:MAG: hypothetical protein ACI8RD_003481 [Bacillariaceae sp.]|jgi:hypothetical protein
MKENRLCLCSRFTSTATTTLLLVLLLLLLSLDNNNTIGFGGVLGFVVVLGEHHQGSSALFATTSKTDLSLGIGEYMIELEKPLGMILEECDGGNGGVQVQEVIKGNNAGNAWKSNFIAPREILSQIDGIDVSKSDFDTVMDLLTTVSSSSAVQLILSDGLGQFDMPKNVVSRLKTTEDAFFIDSIARQAVREIRRDGRLGDLLNVEVIIGAGITNINDNDNDNEWNEYRRGMVRFFAIFSTDNTSSYSCNVSATGVDISGDDDNDGTTVSIKQSENNTNIKIVSLSCAKDEGLGRTFDLIREQ